GSHTASLRTCGSPSGLPFSTPEVCSSSLRVPALPCGRFNVIRGPSLRTRRAHSSADERYCYKFKNPLTALRMLLRTREPELYRKRTACNSERPDARRTCCHKAKEIARLGYANSVRSRAGGQLYASRAADSARVTLGEFRRPAAF